MYLYAGTEKNINLLRLLTYDLLIHWGFTLSESTTHWVHSLDHRGGYVPQQVMRETFSKGEQFKKYVNWG